MPQKGLKKGMGLGEGVKTFLKSFFPFPNTNSYKECYFQIFLLLISLFSASENAKCTKKRKRNEILFPCKQ
jgi:hypothetical protein